jgi:3D (Asp-Asp-Asp) domain-containing protein
MRKYILIAALPLLFMGHGIGASTTCTEISIPEPPEQSIEVTATVYYPTGRKTADGHRIGRKVKNWIAVSRDLLSKFNMGDSVVIEGIDDKTDGVYVIHDKTHRRFRNRIDILTLPGKLRGKWNNVTITKL